MPHDTLDRFLTDLVTRHGDRPAVADERLSLSFADLERRAEAWAKRLRAAGAGRGTHIGLLAGNGAEWLAVAFGVWRLGATLVPVSTFVTARELLAQLEHADVEILVRQPKLRSHDYAEMLSHETLPRLGAVISLDSVASGEIHAASAGLRAAASAGAERAVRAEDIACILYTSGTTGRPKGVMLSHRAILATVAPTAERTGLETSDSLLSTLPLFWVAGLVIRALPTLATGCSLLLVESFTADAVVDLLQSQRPTGLHLRPPQVGEILAHPRFQPSLLEGVRRGGGRAEWFAPHLDPERARFITGYGMTETAGYVTALDWRDPAAARRSQLGTALPGVEIRIVAGEVRIRAPGLYSGYYKEPAGAGLDAGGFFRTGDLGRLDADGGFHFDGRSKDLLRVKGINVSPVEVEAVLSTHPGVEAAYVVGLPADGLEQTVVALIVSKAEPPAETDLRAWAAEALSHYKRPQRYVFVAREDVALGGTSKPQRGELAILAARRA